jgi:UDP:flavonoid glycosyltransferase YjiC (YdhE family)
LRRRQHDVTMAANEHFHPLMRTAGLPVRALGTARQFLEALDSPDLWHPRRALAFIMRELVKQGLEPTYRLVEAERPDVVLATPLALGARVALDKLGVPLASVDLAPAALVSIDAPPHLPGIRRHPPRIVSRAVYWLADHIAWKAAGPQLNGFRAGLGLPPVRHLLTEYWHSPQLILGLFPAWFVGPQTPPDWPSCVRLTGFALYDEREAHGWPAEVESFLRAGPPPVVFTPGSAMRQGAGFFAESQAAVERLGARAIFLTRHAEQVPRALPAQVLHWPFVPLGQLLPRCAALVCHGGIGTVAQGLAAGVPQLLMPMAHDQPDNAARVEALGAGLAVSPARYRGARVARVLQKLLTDPRYRSAAEACAARIRGTHPLDEACARVEDLLRATAPGARQ